MKTQEVSGNGSSNKQDSPFYGKYRGVVSDNKDPWKIGRVRGKVEAVYGDRESGWALPSVPYAGKGVGLFLIPPVGALVWIEFENGDPNYPIWTGCFWADDKVGPEVLPAKPAEPEMKVLKTEIGTIAINDARGKESITIEAKIGNQTMKIEMNASQIEITNGTASIQLRGRTVSINKDGLEVT
ncbi:baseplate assembly protein [Brasilonema sp. CT11]|nr:baseplate assembly protein [Brasilonema sp. CT11]